MRIPTDEEIRKVRERYPEGARVKLVQMDDPQSPPPGTLGTVRYVDDMADVGIAWDNGSSLSIIHGVDEVEILVPDFTDTVRRQILKIRDGAETNMFAVNTVQWIANRESFYELVIFIEEHRKEYAHFIMTGRIC